MRAIISFFIFASFLTTPFVTSAAPEQKITAVLDDEPPDLNSMRSTDQVSNRILGHTNEGLTRYDKNQKIAPGVAEKWTMDKDGKGITFHLRKTAKWSDGKPVTAKDFVFAWRKVVEPATASQYAFFIYPVKNGENINKGKAKPEELGVTAVDDYTLKVVFEKPCAYFLSLVAFTTYFPVREDFYNAQAGRYAADAKNLLFNGPFKLVSWVHGASMRLEKNENYWDKDSIKVSVLDFPYIIHDPKAVFNLFKDKKIDIAGLDSDTLEMATKEKFALNKFAEGSAWYIEFNHRPGRVTGNKALREAIRSVINIPELVRKIIALPGNDPIYTIFPKWLKGVKKPFYQEYPVAATKLDYANAKKLLEQAKKELGQANLPMITLLVDEFPTAKKVGEYFQSTLKKHLGINVMIDVQIFKQRLAKMTAGEFDLVLAGWGPDYDDPMTFADLFTSWNENNRGRYNNPEYDKYIREAQALMEPKKRMDTIAKVQDIVTKEVAVLPIYERGRVYLLNPKVKNVLRMVVGPDPYFGFAHVE